MEMEFLHAEAKGGLGDQTEATAQAGGGLVSEPQGKVKIARNPVFNLLVLTYTVYLFIHVHEHTLTWPSLTFTWNFTVKGPPLVYPTKSY